MDGSRDRPTGSGRSEHGGLVELFSPRSEAELLLFRSVLDDARLYYFVKNDVFGSLALGPQIDHYNRKTVYVHPADDQDARALLAEFLDKTALGEPAPPDDLRFVDVLRMVAEVLLFGWFMPGRRRRPIPPPELRAIQGGRSDCGARTDRPDEA